MTQAPPPAPPANAPPALTAPIASASATRDALLQLATGSTIKRRRKEAASSEPSMTQLS
jgi:hypothetical protein